MKIFLKCIIFPIVIPISLVGQGLIEKKQVDTINSYKSIVFINDTVLFSFNTNKTIFGLTISGRAIINEYNSLVRVVLSDENGIDYLVYENYSEISGNRISDFIEVGEETCILKNNIVPKYFTIMIINAEFEIHEIHVYDGDGDSKTKSEVLNMEHRKATRLGKIDALNRYIKKHGMVWTAGETPQSLMEFRKKQELFGKSYYDHGLEYYFDGFFEYRTGDNEASYKTTSSDLFVESFDWRDKHGANNPNPAYYDGDDNGSGWMTPPRCQDGCVINGEFITCITESNCYTIGGIYRGTGSCATFGSVSALEGLMNIYFNQHIDYDLAEQEIYSCWEGGNAPNREKALRYLKNTGVVPEICFPYQARVVDCDSICSNPTDRIYISDFIGPYSTVNLYKSNLIQYGPLICKYSTHAVALVGWDKIKEGDYINFLESEVIPPGSPYIGTEYFKFKESTSNFYNMQHHPGYLYMINPPVACHALILPITSNVYNESDRRCVDLDADGFYNWGIGSKPSTCPTSAPDEMDGDDSNPYNGPMDEYGNLIPIIPITCGPTIISSNTTWTRKVLCGSLYIKSNSTLTVKGEIKLPHAAKIVIQDGGSLVVDGGTIKNGNITVNSGCSLIMKNNGIIITDFNDKLNAELGSTLELIYGNIYPE